VECEVWLRGQCAELLKVDPGFESWPGTSWKFPSEGDEADLDDCGMCESEHV
jgi:hypothetical protein